MARVSFITLGATYQGELDLTAPTGSVRFLDALNFPHRLAQGASAATPSLTLRDAVRRDDASGVVTPCGPTIALRAGSILLAYEVSTGEATAPREPRAGVAYEARRHAAETTRVVVFLENGLRVECSVGGGLQALNAAKPGGGDFVACQSAEITDTRKAGPARQLSFVGVNVRRIEGAALVAASTGAASSG
jgi:hypothetical protein